MMITLKNPELLHIKESDGHIYFGADQEWYPTLWQRRAGCGPTTASQLILYFQNKGSIASLLNVQDKESMVRLMERVWTFVTPGIMGLHLISQFTEGVDNYLKSISSSLAEQTLQIPRSENKRPPFSQVVDFLVSSLQADSPVAFLNLSRGSLTNLDEWHWVTIVEVEQDTEDSDLYATIYDAGTYWKINMTQWYETTKRGGGLVSYIDRIS